MSLLRNAIVTIYSQYVHQPSGIRRFWFGVSLRRIGRKALHLENKSSAYTPKSAGSALMTGKITLMMLVAVGMRCQNKIPSLCLPLIE